MRSLSSSSQGYKGTVAITGSSGIMGSRVYPALEADGWECIGITSGKHRSQGGPGRKSEGEVNEKLIDRKCDFTNPLQCEGIFHGCTHVLHLAADGRPEASFDEILRSNMVSTYNAMEAARRAGVKRFVFASTNHVQHGSSMALGGGPGSLDASRLGGRKMQISDPATPDSHYAVSKLWGEDMGKLYARVWNHFEFVSLRIGWVLYDDPTELKGTEYEEYLRSMFLSRHDCIEFCKASLTAPLRPEDQGFMAAYAVGNNSTAVFDIAESVDRLGYMPKDSSDDFDWS